MRNWVPKYGDLCSVHSEQRSTWNSGPVVFKIRAIWDDGIHVGVDVLSYTPEYQAYLDLTAPLYNMIDAREKYPPNWRYRTLYNITVRKEELIPLGV
jgi:hypothetical protein